MKLDAETRHYLRHERSRIVKEKTSKPQGSSFVMGQGKRPTHWPPLIVLGRNGKVES